MNVSTPRIVGQVLENHWGTQSSPDGTWSITYDLAGDLLTLKYKTIVHFASERSLNPQVAEQNRVAITLVNEKLAEVKKFYKDVAGTALKTTDIGGNDDVELISMSATSPRKVAYYRYNHAFKLED